MEAKFDVALTKAEYVSGLTTLIVQLGLRDTARNRRFAIQAGAVGLVFVLVGLLFPSAALAVFVAAFATMLVISWWVSWSSRQTSGSSFDPATAAYTVEMSNAKVADHTPGRVRTWDWSAVRDIHDNGTVTVFELAGWDMLILPNRLWNTEAERHAFVEQVRARLGNAARMPGRPPATVKDLFGRDHLYMGAFAAGVDAMFVALQFVPAGYGPADWWYPIAGLAVSALVAYGTYRVARVQLPRLSQRAPRVAAVLSHLLIWALPIYIGVYYLASLVD